MLSNTHPTGEQAKQLDTATPTTTKVSPQNISSATATADPEKEIQSETLLPDACEPCKNVDPLPGWSLPAKVLASVAMGSTFGFMFARSRVFEPMVIRGQFALVNFAMMKMFVAAVGTSSLIFSAVQFTSLRQRFLTLRNKRGNAERHWRGLFLGGSVLGVGMAVGGACPGMVLPQLGAGVPNAVFTYVGGLVGAVLYGLTEQFVRPLLHHKATQVPETEDQQTLRRRSVHLDKHMGWSTRNSMLVVAGLAGVAVALLEVFAPWTNDLPRPNLDGCTTLTCHAVPPALAGIGVGALQLPALFFLNTLLGSSTSYCAMSSSWTNFTEWRSDSLEYMYRFGKFTFSNWWQVFYVLSAVFGAYAAEVSAGGLVSVTGLTPAPAFIGGLLMLYGSRMAGGCTSGHGLSGAPALVIDSIVAVVGIFAGGFVTAGVWSWLAPGTFLSA
jgi:uncharacterized membrane protein YedE/YeeE